MSIATAQPSHAPDSVSMLTSDDQGRPAGTTHSDRAIAAPQRVLSTLNSDGSRRWLRPRISRGRFLTARRVVAYALIAIFTLLPYVRIGGKPAVLLDLSTRHFTIFGTTFLPTDTLLLALLVLSVFVTIFLLTAVLGRVWCGWACPQTVYMEFVFRPIERLFEGPPERKVRGGFRGGPLAKFLKYVAFILVAGYLAHTFLAYFVGVDRLAQWVQRSPFEHPAGFLIVAAVTALMLFDFGIFREQTCILACPYGRFQSVLLDRHSLIIGYDVKRGEPRGKKRRMAQEGVGVAISLPLARTASSDSSRASGDCVDCGLCVTTCPTGIDIRDGLQMECIGCAQCIDACDAVMEKIGRPRGLIRYSSQAAVAGERSHILRPRVIIYPLVLAALVSALAIALANRGPANITVLRGLGATFTVMPSGEIANQVRVKIVNRTESPSTYHIAVSSDHGAHVQVEGEPVIVPAGESRTVPAIMLLPFEAFNMGKAPVKIIVSDEKQVLQQIDWQLMGPGSRTAPPSAEHDREEQPHER